MSLSSHKLKSLINQLETLEREKSDISDSLRQAFLMAKQEGFDPKILKQVLKIRKMKPHEVSEQEELLHLYLHTLEQ